MNQSIFTTLKRWLPDVVAVVLFAVVAFAYFYPADVEDRILYQHDTSAGAGAGQEASVYQQTHDGEQTRWTNGLFSGMPTYQIAPSYDSTRSLTAAEKAYHLWLPDCVWFLFVYLLGFYILLRAFDFRQHLAALGAILWAFSTYFLIIITAGHWWKVMALAYLPPMIAGVVLAYRGKYLWGLVVTALFAAFETHANHYQMTYYYLFVIAAMVIAFIIEGVRKKQYMHLLKATGICLAGAAVGILINASSIYHTKQYEKESERGGSELVKAGTVNSQSNGLERDKILAYSYGIGETWSLLIPNVQGGASMRGDAESPSGTGLYPLSESSAAQAVADQEVKDSNGETFYVRGADGQPVALTNGDIFSQMPQYWGDGGTMGPVYVGALVVLLFVLSLFVVNGPLKWTLLSVTILSVLLAWGSNFVAFSNFFINHVPLYSKFRTPESILVIAEFTMPLLAMLGLKRIVEEPQLLTAKLSCESLMACIGGVLVIVGIALDSVMLRCLGIFLVLAVLAFSILHYCRVNIPTGLQSILDKPMPLTPLLVSFLLTGGVLLLFALMPGMFFDFVSQADREMLPNFGASFFTTLEAVRRSIFTADCWRSLIIIVVGTAVLWLFAAKRLKALPTVVIIAVVCLVDLWQVNRNYLSPDMFRPKSVKAEAHKMTPIDEYILKDKTLDYRVLNLTANPFNENNTSYYHKSIGGYHAAKLGRYKELIDSCLMQEVNYASSVAMMNDSLADIYIPVLNMLNTRYVIAKDNASGRVVPMLNSHAYGNAWFVSSIRYVDNANQELAALHQINLRHEAVADKRFQSVLGSSPSQVTPSSPSAKNALDSLPAEIDSLASAQLLSYAPNELKYSVNSSKGGILVLSEIYYPHGWTATIDGTPADIARVNYVLRALRLQPGRHEVVLTFKPASITTTETLSYTAQALLLLIFIVACALTFRNIKKKL